MKKLLALLLAMILVLSLAACGSTEEEPEAEPETEVEETTTEEADEPEEEADEPLVADEGEKIKTAQMQYDEAKAALEEDIAAKEAAFVEAYGSVEAAYTELDALVEGLAVKAIDDYTLEVQIANPVPYFIDLMTFPSFWPASEAYYNEMGDSYGKSAENFLYNGPFLFSEWKLSERHLITKNEAYWGADDVALKAVDWRVVEGIDNNTAVQLYLDGEVDSTGLSGENVEKYGNRPDRRSIQDTVLFYITMNQGKGEMTPQKEILAIADARKAINMAIDKAYITDVIFNNGSIPADYFVPVGFQANAELGKDFREVAGDNHGGEFGYNGYDPEMAAELWTAALAEAGYPEIEMDILIYSSDTAKKVGTHLKNELEKNLPGLSIKISSIPFSEKLQRADEGNFDLNWAGWGPDYPDAMTWMDMWVTGGPYNETGWSNETYDAVIESAKSGELTDPAKNTERFEQLVAMEQLLLEEHQVIVPLYQRAGIGLRNPAVTNLESQTFGPDYVYKWADIDRDDKTLNLIESENIPALVTWQATDSVSFEILGNINSGLYTLDINGAPTPDIAESVEVSADGLTYTFKLREDAVWAKQDGSVYANVTAHDFVFSWKKLVDPAEAAQYNFMISTAAIVNGVESVTLSNDLVLLESAKSDLEKLSVDDFEDIIETDEE
jgi:ABC-type oligopeptide transport system substrate-binding subunit